jgi:hypothetical protein
MHASVVAGDLHFALDLLHVRDFEPVLLTFPPGLTEVTVLRHGWETVFFETERPEAGPSPISVVGTDLRDALDQPMYIHLGVSADGLIIGDRTINPATLAVPPAPRRSALLGTAAVTLPAVSGGHHRAVLCDIPGGGKVHIHSQLVHRFAVRQISTAQVFRCEPGGWALTGAYPHETHPIAVTGLVTVY